VTVALLHGFPVCSCEWNRFESHRLPESCARILRIERGNADPLGNGSASADIYNLMPARLSPSRHLQIGRSKAGLGLFALVAIKKGQFIVRYSGRKITTEVADQLDTRYLFEVNARWTIDGSSRRNRGHKGLLKVLGVIFAISLLFLLPSCGGGFHATITPPQTGQGATPAGSYTLTVVGANQTSVQVYTVPFSVSAPQ